MNSISLKPPILDTPKIPVKKEEINSITVVINTNKFLSAPVKETDTIGTITVLSTNDVLFSASLTSSAEVDKKDMKNYLNSFFKNYSAILNYSCNFSN